MAIRNQRFQRRKSFSSQLPKKHSQTHCKIRHLLSFSIEYRSKPALRSAIFFGQMESCKSLQRHSKKQLGKNHTQSAHVGTSHTQVLKCLTSKIILRQVFAKVYPLRLCPTSLWTWTPKTFTQELSHCTSTDLKRGKISMSTFDLFLDILRAVVDVILRNLNLRNEI